MRTSALTYKSVCEVFEYNETSDTLTIMASPQSRSVGQDATKFTPKKGRYICVCFNRKHVHYHNIVWVLHNKEDIPPGHVVDHIDGDRMNNHPSNLRLATQGQNCANARRYRSNTTGVKGVSFHRSTGKYIGRVTSNMKTHSAGFFDTIDQAAVAVKKLREKLHGEFANHG